MIPAEANGMRCIFAAAWKEMLKIPKELTNLLRPGVGIAVRLPCEKVIY